MVSVLARGTKKEKSSFGGALDLFYGGTAGIRFRPRSGLHLLTAFRVTRPHPGLRKSLPRFYAACHLAEVLTGLTREEEPYPGLFDRVGEGLALIEASEAEAVRAVLIALELGLLGEFGFAPALEACAACAEPGATARPRLSVALGGILCAQCVDRDETARPFSPGALNALRALSRSPLDRAARVKIPPGDAARIRAFLTAFEEWRLERPLRTAKFLGTGTISEP